jgi:transcription antitermination protein NusB
LRRTDQRRAAVFSSYQHEVTGTPLAQLIERGPFAGELNGGTDESPVKSGPLTDFGSDLVRGVEEHRDELDRLISEHAVDWSVERIAPLERSILRTALYEILYRDDVPEEVAIDEAVETAKVFCGSEAPGFVNGILGSVVRELASSREGSA